jgi:hypothetical protein
MDITDMLCNPPEFTVPSILIKKEREKANQSRVEREKEVAGYFQSTRACVCVWISADFHFYLAKNVCGCWPKGEEEEEDFST